MKAIMLFTFFVANREGCNSVGVLASTLTKAREAIGAMYPPGTINLEDVEDIPFFVPNSDKDSICKRMWNPKLTTVVAIAMDEGQTAITFSAKESIPPDSNPFHYDGWSMGTDLVRGWMIMHAGFDSKENPQSLKEWGLVQTRTGEWNTMHMVTREDILEVIEAAKHQEKEKINVTV